MEIRQDMCRRSHTRDGAGFSFLVRRNDQERQFLFYFIQILVNQEQTKKHFFYLSSPTAEQRDES